MVRWQLCPKTASVVSPALCCLVASAPTEVTQKSCVMEHHGRHNSRIKLRPCGGYQFTPEVFILSKQKFYIKSINLVFIRRIDQNCEFHTESFKWKEQKSGSQEEKIGRKKLKIQGNFRVNSLIFHSGNVILKLSGNSKPLQRLWKAQLSLAMATFAIRSPILQ